MPAFRSAATDLGATADADRAGDWAASERGSSGALGGAWELLADEGKRCRLGRAARRHFDLKFSPAKALGALRDALGAIAGPSTGGRQWA